MRVLQEQSPLDASCVAARACVLAPSLTRMIKTLRDRRFVERMRDSGGMRDASMLSNHARRPRLHRDAGSGAALDIHDAIRSRYGAERMEILIDMLNDLADFRARGPTIESGRP